jgi:hypothetical protein
LQLKAGMSLKRHALVAIDATTTTSPMSAVPLPTVPLRPARRPSSTDEAALRIQVVISVRS